MSDFDLIELMTAIIGSIAAIATVAGAVFQYKAARLELRSRQEIRQEPSVHPKSADGKPPQ
ncbi:MULTISPECIES: hypothetical protein [Glycomyces]|jgi:uncharacterized membrane protein YccC|uniref:Membrane protein YccC n=2 Tax=Glycomyces TaxID=58113 RepID=A0A9X3SXL4_9ACTN|nr:hypothetical protein [Glycomyces lechevalierae]MDA1385276.1 hypothetical protein [Glycomyces lechevalierae]MDR7337107.1 putative membrane protein YccC [Glycomyces lechevalierae]